MLRALRFVVMVAVTVLVVHWVSQTRTVRAVTRQLDPLAERLQAESDKYRAHYHRTVYGY
jgi:Flp pilus assembly protein TadB